MAKVVGRDEAAVKRITCRRCASVIEYSLTELRDVKVNMDHLGDCDIVKALNCPNCGHLVRAT